MKFTYYPEGVCSRQIDVEVEDDIIQDVKFVGGCNGNLKGIGALLKGMNVDEAIDRLVGIKCGVKPTSCPDQLAKALKSMNE